MGGHLKTCGTKYRGCDPECPKDMEEREESIKEYVENKGKFCPYCNSILLEKSSVSTGSEAYGTVRCSECCRTWMDEYKLTGMIEIDG